jgi:hypothetical protein
MKNRGNEKIRGPITFRDVNELTKDECERRFSVENAKIKGRTDPKTGEKIPDGMPLWRWRKRRVFSKK